MEHRVKDITGECYKFNDVSKSLENREQIIFRFKDNSEIIFIKKNIIYAVTERADYEAHAHDYEPVDVLRDEIIDDATNNLLYNN